MAAVATGESEFGRAEIGSVEHHYFPTTLLGWMKKLNPEINGVNGSESNPTSTTDPHSTRVFFDNKSHFVDPDPGHSFQAIRAQIFGSNDTSLNPAPMNGFAQQAESMEPDMPQSVMNGFDPYIICKPICNSHTH
ncbi:hypothetical protein RJ640_013321 [Escallonia rubra]|uniref:Uncharacterized protein n=1 Tax=Escallonia rubra TaxID=112253 RepID=A0AA88UJA2_9ASTE|nr:hypothetical protein RJ640_013321 [Escallonia rubra]